MNLSDHSSEISSISDDSKGFNILLHGFEGPIDLLLDLAKKQKVDLSEISVLALAEQYINFIENYQNIHLELAADYLVMAAWLTYLKSRLLLPKEENEDEYTPEELEEALKYQLQRLEAMQKISKKLYSRALVGRDIFYGGTVDNINIKYKITYTSTLFDLLKSYSLILNKAQNIENLTINLSELHSVDQAIKRLQQIFGSLKEWTNFINLLPKFGISRIINKSCITSNFVASLEMIKNGYLEFKQNETFGNIYIKSKNGTQ
mgnify:CR=1 FL=1